MSSICLLSSDERVPFDGDDGECCGLETSELSVENSAFPRNPRMAAHTRYPKNINNPKIARRVLHCSFLAMFREWLPLFYWMDIELGLLQKYTIIVCHVMKMVVGNYSITHGNEIVKCQFDNTFCFLVHLEPLLHFAHSSLMGNVLYSLVVPISARKALKKLTQTVRDTIKKLGGISTNYGSKEGTVT